MNADFLFNLSGPAAIAGWLALLAAPFAPRLAQMVAAAIIPLLLSIAYTALALVTWADAPGGYDTLANVMLLFDTPMVALAGWVHYLAFDLLIGAWEVRTARKEGISHFLVIPCLFLTFMFGPIGFLLFMAIRYARTLTSTQTLEA